MASQPPPFLSPQLPSSVLRPLPFDTTTSYADDVGDFKPSGRRGAVMRKWSQVTLDDDAKIEQQFLKYREKKGLSLVGTPSAVLYDNEAIVGFLSAKINDAIPGGEEEGTGATLSVVSLKDRFLPALKRLQLREAKGVSDESGWEEVKDAVISRANIATLPLVSKGEWERVPHFRSSLCPHLVSCRTF
jgi:hypothetical protein